MSRERKGNLPPRADLREFSQDADDLVCLGRAIKLLALLVCCMLLVLLFLCCAYASHTDVVGAHAPRPVRADISSSSTTQAEGVGRVPSPPFFNSHTAQRSAKERPDGVPSAEYEDRPSMMADEVPVARQSRSGGYRVGVDGYTVDLIIHDGQVVYAEAITRGGAE